MSSTTSTPGTGTDIAAVLTARLEREQALYLRRTRVVMAVEAVIALALGAAGLAGTTAAATMVATIVGIRLGVLQFALLVITGLAILAALDSRRALRRVAITAAVAWMIAYVVGAVLSPFGMWDTNVAGVFVPVVIALAGLMEFVLLGSSSFVSTPSAPPSATQPVPAADPTDEEAR